MRNTRKKHRQPSPAAVYRPPLNQVDIAIAKALFSAERTLNAAELTRECPYSLGQVELSLSKLVKNELIKAHPSITPLRYMPASAFERVQTVDPVGQI